MSRGEEWLLSFAWSFVWVVAALDLGFALAYISTAGQWELNPVMRRVLALGPWAAAVAKVLPLLACNVVVLAAPPRWRRYATFFVFAVHAALLALYGLILTGPLP